MREEGPLLLYVSILVGLLNLWSIQMPHGTSRRVWAMAKPLFFPLGESTGLAAIRLFTPPDCWYRPFWLFPSDASCMWCKWLNLLWGNRLDREFRGQGRLDPYDV